nr:DUF732 domain-containing protein [Mycolicibacterium komanii]CRL76806.1 hypothetical protein CPGR_04611 [Mycolicibacterium komanii]
MRRIIGSLIAAAGTAVAFAAPAAADQADFVRQLQEKYVFLGADQLISAGNQACAAGARGVPAAETVMRIRDELGISTAAAGDIVSLAVVELGC